MEYTEKIIRQSQYWYNDGLRKAQIKDISGAILSLRRSLKYNHKNIDARNLLGLVYYERGEVAEGLVEWIISKNLGTSDNIAGYFIKEVQKSTEQLEAINEAVKSYNQSLAYCKQHSEDLAVLQLKKAIEAHPSFLKAYQLLAMIYIHMGQSAKARPLIKEARKLDTTNDQTLRLMHELSVQHDQKVKNKGERGSEVVEYNLGNDTIIQPKYTGVKRVSVKSAFLNLILGVAAGALIVWFLIVPAVQTAKNDSTNKQMVEYGERINSLKSQISAQTRALDQYRKNEKDVVDNLETAAGTAESYEKLMNASEQWKAGNYSAENLCQVLVGIKKDSLLESGKTLYDRITADVYPVAASTLYNSGNESFDVANYETAIHNYDLVVRMYEDYDNGGALLNLGLSLLKSGDKEQATPKFKRVIELYPNTEKAKQAQTGLDIISGGEESVDNLKRAGEMIQTTDVPDDSYNNYDTGAGYDDGSYDDPVYDDGSYDSYTEE